MNLLKKSNQKMVAILLDHSPSMLKLTFEKYYRLVVNYFSQLGEGVGLLVKDTGCTKDKSHYGHRRTIKIYFSLLKISRFPHLNYPREAGKRKIHPAGLQSLVRYY